MAVGADLLGFSQHHSPPTCRVHAGCVLPQKAPSEPQSGGECQVGVGGLNGPTSWSSDRDENLQQGFFFSSFFFFTVSFNGGDSEVAFQWSVTLLSH